MNMTADLRVYRSAVMFFYTVQPVKGRRPGAASPCLRGPSRKPVRLSNQNSVKKYGFQLQIFIQHHGVGPLAGV